MNFFAELKKVKARVYISVIILLVIGSCLIFFNGYIRSGAVRAYELFTGLIYAPEETGRMESDNTLVAEYTATPRETGGLRAVTVTMPEYDTRTNAADAYEDYVVPELNVQLQYAQQNGFTHILYRCSLYSRQDFDVAAYLKEQCAGMGLKLILETDALLLHEVNGESGFSSGLAPVYETVEKNFWQRLFYPRKAPLQNLISGIAPEWVYIADDGSKRLNPSYEGARDFALSAVEAMVSEYEPDMLVLDAPVYGSKTLFEGELLSKFENMSIVDMHLRSTQLQVIAVSKLLAEQYPDIRFGLCADSVWRTAANDDRGIATAAAYSDYDKGCADTLLWLERGYADFVVVRNHHALSEGNGFETVLKWWKNVRTNTGVAFVNGYSAQLIGSNDNWGDYYELANQYDIAVKNGCASCLVDDCAALIEHSDEATLLHMAFENTIDFGIADEELRINSPKDGVTVDVPTIAVSGTCDNNFPIYINGKETAPTERGFFAADVELDPGKNTITVEHKGKTVTLTVSYNLVVIKDISPTGKLSVMGGSTVEYSVTARKGAKVNGALNGKSVSFTELTSRQENESAESVFATFVGVFTVPEARNESYSIGAAKVTASYGGFTKTLTGATVTIEPLPVTVGNIAVVKETLGETFRAEPANSDTSLPQYYWLPKGTMDYIVGESVYAGNGETKKYFTLQCGLRVYQHEVEVLQSGSIPMNTTGGVTVVGTGRYTYLTFANSQKVPYLVSTNGLYPAGDMNATTATVGSFASIDIILCHTANAADVTVGSASPLLTFSNASVNAAEERLTYTFSLNEKGMFCGFTSYYDDNGSLVIRLRNPISTAGGRLDGVKFCIDPGHGGVDSGASGFNSVHEADENLKVAFAIKSQLEALGATVYLTRDNNQTYTDGTPITAANLREPRIDLISSFNVDILISVHHNWYSSSSANGTEALYFYGFNQGLAKSVSDSMAAVSGMRNRGGKYQNVFVYRNHEFMSILLECGFLSNPSDAQWLATEGNTDRLAKAVVDGVIRYFS